MAGLWDAFVKQWDSWPVQLVIWGSILALMVAISYFVLRRLRGFAVGNDDTPLELLTNFREMKVQGDISDKEFRTIKALLNEKQAPSIKHNQDAT
jgi:hypothetical protein